MCRFLKLSGHCYVVENQNGFNNALYDYFDCGNNNDGYSKEKIRKMVQNFPKSYPTTIIIIDQTFECNRIYIEEIKTNKPCGQIELHWLNMCIILQPEQKFKKL